jgi:hypothetical protein
MNEPLATPLLYTMSVVSQSDMDGITRIDRHGSTYVSVGYTFQMATGILDENSDRNRDLVSHTK